MQGFSIIEPSDILTVETIFAVLYGAPGVGKTSASFTMPGEILHIDADRGLKRAIQKRRPKSVQVDQYGPFHAWVFSDAFEAYVKEHGIKSVVIDTAGALLDNLISAWLIKNDPKAGNATGGLTLQGWGALKTSFNSLSERFKALKINVLCICHAKEEGEGNNVRFELAVSGGSKEIIYRTADLIGYVSIQGPNRVVNFNPTSTNVGKNVGNLPVFNIPASETDKYDTFMADVIGQVTANMQAQSETQLKFAASLAEWKELLSAVNTPSDFDGFIKSASELPKGLLSTTVKRLLGDRMTEKAVKFDKESGKVVSIEPAKEPVNEEA